MIQFPKGQPSKEARMTPELGFGLNVLNEQAVELLKLKVSRRSQGRD
jgi:hypothetical protein